MNAFHAGLLSAEKAAMCADKIQDLSDKHPQVLLNSVNTLCCMSFLRVHAKRDCQWALALLTGSQDLGRVTPILLGR